MVSGLCPGSRRLQRACASVSLPVWCGWHTQTPGGPLLAVLEMKQALLSFFQRQVRPVPVLYWSLPSYSHVFPTKLMSPVLLWGCHQVTVTELCDIRWDKKAQGSACATPTYSGHQHLGLPLVKGPVQCAKFCFSKAIFMSLGINVDNTGSIFLV